jgi:hypothetical protein
MSSLVVSNLIVNDDLTLYCPFADNFALLSPTANFLNVRYTMPSLTNTRQYNLLPLTSQGTVYPLTPLPSPTTLTSLGICYEVKMYNPASDNYAVLRLKSSQLSIDYTLPGDTATTFGYNVMPILASQPTATAIPTPLSLNSLEVQGKLKILNTTLNNYVLFDLASDYLHIRYTLPGGTDEFDYAIVPIVSSTLPAPPVADTIPSITMGTLPSSIQEGSSAFITYTFSAPIQAYQQAYLIFSVAPGVNSISNTFTGLTGGTIQLTAGTYNPLTNTSLSFTINYLCSTNLFTSPSIAVTEVPGVIFPPAEYTPTEFNASSITYPGTTQPIYTSRLVFYNGSNAVYFICQEPGQDIYTLPKVANQVQVFTSNEQSQMKQIATSVFGTVNIMVYDVTPSTQRLIYLESGTIRITTRTSLSLPLVPGIIAIGSGLQLSETYVNRTAQAVGYIETANLVVYYYELATTVTVPISVGGDGAYSAGGQVLFVHHLGELCQFAVVGSFVAWASGDTLYLANLPGNGYSVLTVIDSVVMDPVTDVIMNVIELNGALRVYHGDANSTISIIWGEKFTVTGGVLSRIFRNEIELPLEMDMGSRIGYTWDMASQIKDNLLMCVGRGI